MRLPSKKLEILPLKSRIKTTMPITSASFSTVIEVLVNWEIRKKLVTSRRRLGKGARKLVIYTWKIADIGSLSLYNNLKKGINILKNIVRNLYMFFIKKITKFYQKRLEYIEEKKSSAIGRLNIIQNSSILI